MTVMNSFMNIKTTQPIPALLHTPSSSKEVRGEVHIKKIDKDTQDSVSQGDGDLNGAVYGLYAAEDIQHPNGKTGLLYKKDQLVVQGNDRKGSPKF